MRVHELAKEFDLTSKALLAVLAKIGIEAKSHASSLTEADVSKVKKHFKGLAKSKTEEVVPDTEEAGEFISAHVEGVKEDPASKKNKKKNEEETADLQVIEIEEGALTVKEFAEKINVPLTKMMTVLLKKGLMLNLNQNIELSLAEEVAQEFEILIDIKAAKMTNQQQRVEDAFLAEIDEDARFLKERPPVVTVMGHVDHGKTKLLDAIRNTNVVDSEHGGITQHIGAYQVHINNKDITFIDTPGHEAFTEIRARGAHITDIVILVVAADDGIMPQTVEAISHAKAAKVPIIVAINKVDKPDSNIDRVKQQLTEYDMVPEEWGGNTIVVPISALTGQGVPELLEMILLVSEMEELKANPHKKAMGIIIESRLSKSRGPIVTVLVKAGTLRVGTPFVIGPIYGKVRALMDDRGEKLKEAIPSRPVEIMGLSGVPNAGDVLQVVGTEKEAKKIAEQRRSELNESQRTKKKGMSFEEYSQKIHEGGMAVLNVLIKGDVNGSLEAIAHSINKVKVNKTTVNIVYQGVGVITESDLLLAKASEAIIIGFNVPLPIGIKNKAEDEGVAIKLYHIIYKLVEDLTDILKGLLKPTMERFQIGLAEVRALFKYSKVGIIAGCYITEGKAIRGAQIEVYRADAMVYEGKLDSLKRFADDVKEVQTGYECGIVCDGFDDFKEKDSIIVYSVREKK